MKEHLIQMNFIKKEITKKLKLKKQKEIFNLEKMKQKKQILYNKYTGSSYIIDDLSKDKKQAKIGHRWFTTRFYQILSESEHRIELKKYYKKLKA